MSGVSLDQDHIGCRRSSEPVERFCSPERQSEVETPGSTNWRALIPERCWIHSSEVSTVRRGRLLTPRRMIQSGP